MTVNAIRLNHAVLFVADLDRSAAFYQQAFDMVIMAREPRADAAILRLPRSGNHHDLGLFGVGEQSPRPRGSIGLYHLAWQVDTIDELEVMWMLPKDSWGDFANAAPIERLDLPGEMARWSGVRTAAELVPVEAR